MPHFKRPNGPMGPNFGKMAINHTHNFIMERAKAVGNVPMMKAKAVAPKRVSYKQAGMQGKSTKLATGGPSNLKVPGKRVNSEGVRVISSSKAPMTQNKVTYIASSPEKMSKGPYKQRTLGVQEFGQYLGGTGKRGRS